MPVREAARTTRSASIQPVTAAPPARAVAGFDPGRLDEERPYGRHARGVVRPGRSRKLVLVAVATVALAAGVPLVLGVAGEGPRAYPRAQRPPTGPRVQLTRPPAIGATSSVPPSASSVPSPAAGLDATTDAGPAAPGGDAGATTAAAGAAVPEAAGAAALVAAGPAPPPPSSTPAAGTPASTGGAADISIEAEAPSVIRAGAVSTRTVASASGGTVVTGIGNGSANTVQFSAITVPAADRYTITFHYLSGGERRRAAVSVNGQVVTTMPFSATADWETVGTASVLLRLAAGPNTVEVSNASAPAPDLDRIVITP